MNFIKSILKIYFSIFLIIIESGCGSSVNIPKPQLNKSLEPSPIQLSLVNIPVSINLKPVINFLEKNVPVEIASDSSWTDTDQRKLGMAIGSKFHVWRDAFKISMNGNILTIEAHFKYWVAGALAVPNPFSGTSSWQKIGSCGLNEPKREAIISLSTKFELQKDGHFKTTSKVNTINFPNLCGVTILNFDVTPLLNSALTSNLNNLVSSVDSRIAQISNFRDICSTGWTRLQEPIKLDSTIWLMVNPVVPCIAPFSGSGLSVSTSIGIVAKPMIVFGQKPSVQITPLPELNLNAPRAGSHVVLEGNLPFDIASKIISQKLVGNKFVASKFGVNIEEALIYGSGETTVLKLDVSGDIQGSIYLTGTPYYEIANDSLYIKNLDYSIETKNILANSADWFLHSGFRQMISEQTHWELGGQIAAAKEKMSLFLNPQPNNSKSPPLLFGSVNNLNSVAVYSNSDSFHIVVIVDGNVGLNLENTF
ncbi:MAG: DUF4403 family protein [Ignavibacteriaceae bacterium]|nr:DUF4403 family protein [Ignavibacteriaceae bacterium]